MTTRHSRIFFQRFARQHSIAPCSWFIVQERGYTTTLAVLNSQRVVQCGPNEPHHHKLQLALCLCCMLALLVPPTLWVLVALD